MKPSPESSDRLERLERITELPLMLLSFVLVPVLAGLYIWELSTVERAIYTILEVLIWAAFAMVFFLKLALAPRKLRYLKNNWAEALIVFVPIFRPLRIAAVSSVCSARLHQMEAPCNVRDSGRLRSRNRTPRGDYRDDR